MYTSQNHVQTIHDSSVKLSMERLKITVISENILIFKALLTIKF